MNYRELYSQLEGVYDAGEARAVVRLLLEEAFGMSWADVLGGALERLDSSQERQLTELMSRLQSGEPVQYVVGHAWFCDRRFMVGPGVLIPRPETEELVQWILADGVPAGATLLDIGTGSGCIACTLACEVKDAHVMACDISDAALDIARRNARELGVDVSMMRHDVLSGEPFPLVQLLQAGSVDVVVSNPPYICRHEASSMEDNVLRHEPHEALFVPDDDALLFYRAIAQRAKELLRPGGSIYFEINPDHANELEALVSDMGFSRITLRDDQFGRCRMMRVDN